MATIQEFATANITVEIEKDRGMQVDKDHWEHHAYVLRVSYDGRSMLSPWMQGTGIESSPTDEPGSVLESLISDARNGEESFEDFADSFGYDEDSRAAYRTWEACQQIRSDLAALLGDAFDSVMELDSE